MFPDNFSSGTAVSCGDSIIKMHPPIVFRRENVTRGPEVVGRRSKLIEQTLHSPFKSQSHISGLLTLFNMGYFKNTTVWGTIMPPPPLVTLVFLKVEGQKLVTAGILMCFLQNWH